MKKRKEGDGKRSEKMSSNKFLEGIPVLLTRFATGPLEEVPPEERTIFFSVSLSLSLSLFSDCLQPVLFSSFVSLFSMLGLVHSFKGRRRRRSSGGYTHKSEPDFQHLLQSRKTAVWNDFGLAKAFACAPSRLRRDAFLYSIESSKSTGAYVFELFSTEGRPNDRLTPLSFTR